VSVLVLVSGVAGAIEIVLDDVMDWKHEEAWPQFDISSTKHLKTTLQEAVVYIMSLSGS